MSYWVWCKNQWCWRQNISSNISKRWVFLSVQVLITSYNKKKFIRCFCFLDWCWIFTRRQCVLHSRCFYVLRTCWRESLILVTEETQERVCTMNCILQIYTFSFSCRANFKRIKKRQSDFCLALWIFCAGDLHRGLIILIGHVFFNHNIVQPCSRLQIYWTVMFVCISWYIDYSCQGNKSA